MDNTHASFIKFIQQQVAQGKNVVIGDNEHMNEIPRKIIGNPTLLSSISKKGGTLIIEGPQTLNQSVKDFNSGTIDEKQIRDIMHRDYQVNNPVMEEKWNRAYGDIFVNAKSAKTHVFFPEKNTAYNALQDDPQGESVYEKVASEITSSRCVPIQIEPIIKSLSKDELQALTHFYTTFNSQRVAPDENNKILEGIATQPAPYVVLYGEGHRADLAGALKATTVGIVASEKSGYMGDLNAVPEYVYFADTDHLLHIPEGSKERAQFLAKQSLNPKGSLGTKTFSLGTPLSKQDEKDCFNALPPEVRYNTLHPALSGQAPPKDPPYGL